MLEHQRIGAQISRSLEEPDNLGATLVRYSLFRVEAHQNLLPTLNARDSWTARGEIYRVGSLVQRKLTEFVAGNISTPQNTSELVLAAEAEFADSDISNSGSKAKALAILRNTIMGAATTAVAATAMQHFVKKGWEYADADLDVEYAIDVVFEDGSRLQSKALQPENYRDTKHLERRIFQGYPSAIQIPILRFVDGKYELQFAPLALVPYGDTGAILHMHPHVLHAVSDRVLVFDRPIKQRKYDYEKGLAEALLIGMEAVVDPDFDEYTKEVAVILGIDLSEAWPKSSDSTPDAVLKLMQRSGALSRIDNFDILERIRQTPGLTAFAKDVTRALLLSVKADQSHVFWGYEKVGGTVYYAETALFDTTTKTRPALPDFVTTMSRLIQIIPEIKDAKFTKHDSFADYPYERSEYSEHIPTINLS